MNADPGSESLGQAGPADRTGLVLSCGALIAVGLMLSLFWHGTTKKRGSENDARLAVDFAGLPPLFGWFAATRMPDGRFHVPIQRGPGTVRWDFFGRAIKADDCAYPVLRGSSETLFTGKESIQFPSKVASVIIAWRAVTKLPGEAAQEGPWKFVSLNPRDHQEPVAIAQQPELVLSSSEVDQLWAALEASNDAVNDERDERRHGRPR